MTEMNKVAGTDWDAYYQQVPGYTQFFRSISFRRVVRTIALAVDGNNTPSVCESGGANSRLIPRLIDKFGVKDYQVIDTNSYGLQLTPRQRGCCAITTELSDVTGITESREAFDLVFSVGLIEHFDRQGTARAIRAHFELCRKGGHVLITFPTPTLLYRSLRWVAENRGIWKFPDERPLQFEEVEDSGRLFGEAIHKSVNWWIGLTQGYVLFKKT